MTIAPQHLEALQTLGYTSTESEFLYLVAIHSGYFTHRQFLSFTQTEPGCVSHGFLTKLLERNHASFHTYRKSARVYHLFSRRVYKAIDRDNLRTRRRHQLDYIKTRLVVLDFVLAHSDYHYLETEAEKVPFFDRECNVSQELLPAKLYRATKSREATRRFFVDRFPVFVNTLGFSPVVTLTYVDPDSVSVQPFHTHLSAYAHLLVALPEFELLYLAPTSRNFKAAEAEFYATVFGRSGRMSGADLLRYFGIRKAWESNDRVPSSDVLFLKEAKRRYSNKQFDFLFGQWCVGQVKDAGVANALEAFSASSKGVFKTLICGSSLSVFDDPGVGSAESLTRHVRKEGSGILSGEVSGS